MAAYIPDDKITAVRNASDIVDIISEVVSLRRSGRNFLGLCPFHAEKTPSFTVSQEKQIFYCFGCGAGGNVFSFLMKHGGLTFPEAVRTLGGRYGIDLPTRKMSPAQKKKLTERETILTLNVEAMSFYRNCLISDEKGKPAMTYLLKRGMTRKTIDDFNLGYSPKGWDNLAHAFRLKKRSTQMIFRSGLIVSRKSGDGHYDRFRDRIMFPIMNGQSQVIGFGGRVMDDALPKYLNSPETPVYNKSRSLFGVDKARAKCREKKSVYVVEGYFDLIVMHQFGIENTVATLGTSLTGEHVRSLKSIVGEGGTAILVYDSDQAGIKAAQRSVAVFQKGLLDARILVLPKDHDPDSFLREKGSDQFFQASEQSLGMISFMMESAIEKYGLSVDGKVHIVNGLKSALSAINDPVARSLRIKQLSERIGVDESILLQKVRHATIHSKKGNLQRSYRSSESHTEPEKTRGGTYRFEKQVVTMMLQFPEMIGPIKEQRFVEYFSDPVLSEIGKGIIDHFSNTDGDISGFVSCWDDTEKKSMIARLSLADVQWDRQGCIKLINQFAASLRRRDKTLIQRIETAEKNGDVTLLAKLLREKQHQIH